MYGCSFVQMHRTKDHEVFMSYSMVSEFSVSYLMMSLGSRKNVAIWKHVPLTFLQ